MTLKKESTAHRIIVAITMLRAHLITPTKIILGKKTFENMKTDLIEGNFRSSLNESKKLVFKTPYEICNRDFYYRIYDAVCTNMGKDLTKDADYLEHCKIHLGMDKM